MVDELKNKIEELEKLYKEKKISKEKFDKQSNDIVKNEAQRLLDLLDARKSKRDNDMDAVKECMEIIKQGKRSEGLDELKKLHKTGNIYAANFLGAVFYKGQLGVEKDFELARKYFEASAKEFNNSISQSALALMYFKGEGGLKKNIFDAYYWSDLAVKNDGNQSAINFKKSIEDGLSSEHLLKAKGYIKLKNDEKKLDEELDQLFLGDISKEEDDTDEEEDDSMVYDYWYHAEFEKLESFDVYDDLRTGDAFNELSGLDEFVLKKAVQNIKKIVIPSYYFNLKETPLKIPDISPLESLKKLNELDFFEIEGGTGGFKCSYYSSKIFKNITRLRIDGLADLNFIKNFPNLEYLAFMFPYLEDDTSLNMCDLSFLKNLKKLTLDYPDREEELGVFCNIKSLETLKIRFFDQQNNNIEKLWNLHNLHTLTLNGEGSFEVKNFINIPNLKNLYLGKYIAIPDIDLFETNKIKVKRIEDE